MAKKRAKKNPYAHLAIFRGKDYARSRPAAMTKDGYAAFEAARKRLAVYVGREATTVSDADVIEYLARGESNTINYLRGTLQFKE